MLAVFRVEPCVKELARMVTLTVPDDIPGLEACTYSEYANEAIRKAGGNPESVCESCLDRKFHATCVALS